MNNEKLSFINDVINNLNKALEDDPVCINNLLFQAFECNEKLANNSTMQVVETKDGFLISTLGFINGLLGINQNTEGYIVAECTVDENKKPISISKFILNK